MRDRECSKFKNKTKATYNTRWKIEENSNTWENRGCPKFQNKVKTIYNSNSELGDKINTDCKIEGKLLTLEQSIGHFYHILQNREQIDIERNVSSDKWTVLGHSGPGSIKMIFSNKNLVDRSKPL